MADPINDFDLWNELPNELKKRCISKMNVQTRQSLKRTCRNECLLVSLVKVRFTSLYVWFTGWGALEGYYTFDGNDHHEYVFTYKSVSVVDRLHVDNAPATILDHVSDNSLNVKNLAMLDCNENSTMAALSKCITSNIRVFQTFHRHVHNFPIDLLTFELLESLQLLNVSNVAMFGFPVIVAGRWMMMRDTVGKKMQFATKSKQTMAHFQNEYHDRSQYHPSESVCKIGTDSAGISIVLKFEQELEDTQYFIMGVVRYDDNEGIEDLWSDMDALTPNGIW
ncbi:hypothetical protein B9Z55_028947 [Caenorhabditis nigoni]|uniref:F-box domain-containing protein n=2 Tax=Caenorhabditis nigoni TaxID=1611254 RepID=A0A2G5S9P2_9PELO|nr:hypothetical protein B9Z55_028947 [Caenorhabditis nigoni]